MKAIILAGGLGTRLSEATHLIPKPMVEIGGKPILWHIMKIYSQHGIDDFIVCCGYKAYVIKEYFFNYFKHNSDITVDLVNDSVIVHNQVREKWKITLIDTGLNTMTGGRIKRVQDYIGNEPFLLTYGDGVGDINIADTIRFHKEKNVFMTVTAYKPKGKFGAMDIMENGMVKAFQEKPAGDGAWINAGFFVCEPQVFDYIKNSDQTILEREPMEQLALAGKMASYKHEGFWKPMDTLRDSAELNEMWNTNSAPWKTWE